MRLFVAIEAPETWRRTAAAVQHALPPEYQGVLRPVAPHLMHVTLRFLGEVEDSQVPALTAALRRHAPPVAMDLALGRAGTFGQAGRAHVVHLHVDGDVEGLRALAGHVDAAVEEALGRPPPERTATPHLTLARVHRRATPGERRGLAEATRSMPAPPATPFTVERVVLVRSHLGPDGPRYEVLAHVGRGTEEGTDEGP